jgi:hypothetical protein
MSTSGLFRHIRDRVVIESSETLIDEEVRHFAKSSLTRIVDSLMLITMRLIGSVQALTPEIP